MRFRTIALALALTFGLSGIGEAKKRPSVSRVKPRKVKAHKNTRLKTRKVKVSKRRVAKR
jgi:hypothetical protein